MTYKPTGRPPGRPRKTEPVEGAPIAPTPPAPQSDDTPKLAHTLTRARRGYQMAAVDPADGLWRPPRARGRQAGRRPILHPHVIAKA